MFDTIENIIDAVLTELGLVNGSSVQTYTEPQIRHNINVAFQTLFSKRFWPHLTRTTLHTLDGSAGVITDTLASVNDFDDIEWLRFYPYTRHEELVRLRGVEWEEPWRESFDRIPYGETHWDSKVFQVFPADFLQPIKVRARRFPGQINTGVVPFDKIAITHLTAANILASDGMNPNSEQRQNGLFDQRYTDLIANEASGISYFSPSYSNTFRVAE